MSNAVLEMTNIKKSFDGLEVLKDISLSVHRGEVVSVIGPSGSGKSTLLRCAVNLERIDSGNISYNGQLMARTTDSGIVHYASKKELQQNITEAPLKIKKRDKDEVEAQAVRLMEKMGIADKKDAYPCQLSGGQQQRVSIARALAMNPDILFFDEPTSARRRSCSIQRIREPLSFWENINNR